MMEEHWVYVKGYDKRYMVSDRGRVKSCFRYSIQHMPSGKIRQMPVYERILSQEKRLYNSVDLNKNNVCINEYIPKIMLESFYDYLAPQFDFHHINDNRYDDRLENLAFGKSPMPEGTWKPIVDHPSYYISSDGRVYRETVYGAEHRLSVYHHLVKPTKGIDNRYLYVSIDNKNCSVHRLVANAFLDKPEPNMTVNHKDGNPQHNDVSNLEWLSIKDNIQHAIRTGLRSELVDVKHLQMATAKNCQPVVCVNTGEQYSSIAEAATHLDITAEGLRSSIKTGKPLKSGLLFRKIIQNTSTTTNLSRTSLKQLQTVLGQDIIDAHSWRYVCLPELSQYLYAVCEDGSYAIRFLNNAMNHSRGSIKLWTTKDYTIINSGYMMFDNILVHRAVASAFLSNDGIKDCINHKDGNKQNNLYTNLEWCTRKENMQHYRQADCFKEKRVIGDAKARQAVTGRHIGVSQSRKKKQSQSMRQMYAKKGKTVWVHKDFIETIIREAELDDYLVKGYIQGRLNSLDIYIHKDNKTIKIKHEDKDKYLQGGWQIGKSDRIAKNIKDSQQLYVWCYNDCKFASAKELAAYLNTHGYPNIVASTVTALYNKGFDKSKVYHTLDGKITRYENKKD